MTETRPTIAQTETEAFLSAVRSEDQAMFGRLVEQYRSQLHVHCYRMLASFDEAEELVQETYLRAWRARKTFAGNASLRSWLYRIATNASLDRLRLRARRATEFDSIADLSWLQPYPDRLLDEAASSDPDPAAAVVAKETIELTYMTILQLLPPRQRAVLILRDVLGWSASETAESLSTTVTAVNSALQRAKSTLRRQMPERRVDWEGGHTDPDEVEVLRRFISAVESNDVEAVLALAYDDIEIAMPPIGKVHNGREAYASLARRGLSGSICQWLLKPTRANRQPALANYRRRPDHQTFQAFKVDVLRIEGGTITQIVGFGAELFPEFNLPLTINPGDPTKEAQ